MKYINLMHALYYLLTISLHPKSPPPKMQSLTDVLSSRFCISETQHISAQEWTGLGRACRRCCPNASLPASFCSLNSSGNQRPRWNVQWQAVIRCPPTSGLLATWSWYQSLQIVYGTYCVWMVFSLQLLCVVTWRPCEKWPNLMINVYFL